MIYDCKIYGSKKIFTIRPVLASDKTYTDETQSISELIAENNRDEQTAIANYENLILRLNEVGADTEDIDHIREIISDEKNHSEILNEILLKYDEITPNID